VTIGLRSWVAPVRLAVAGAAALLCVACGDDTGATDGGHDGGGGGADAGVCIPNCTGRTCGLDPMCGLPCAPGCGAGQECVAGSCPAGPTWTEATPAEAPGVRSGHAMAYDAARERVVLFGGWNSIEALGDTWVFDGTTWTEITPSTSPPPRLGGAMAYDATRERVVLFGGNDGTMTTSRLGDTWELDGATWIGAAPATSPGPRSDHAMAYDSARARIVLFGGEGTAPGGLADTWEYDGTNWAEATPTASPTRRALHAMAYDAARGRVVLFSGDDGGRPRDTWEYDGTTWSETTPAVSPTGRRWHSLAYDGAHERVVLYGGLGLGDTELGDTWQYGGP